MVLVYKARAANVCFWQPITTVQTLAQSFGRMAKLLFPPNATSRPFLRLFPSSSLPSLFRRLYDLLVSGGGAPKNQWNFRYDFVEHEIRSLFY